MNRDETIVKVCNVCSLPKPISDFHRNKKSKDGHVGKCKECACAISRRWNSDNPERKKSTGKKWREENREKDLQSSAEWRKNNPERSAAIKREWLESNREHHNEKNREWIAKNPDRRREIWWLSSYKSRIARLGLSPIIGEGEEEVTVGNLVSRWGDKCFHCSGLFEVLDHYPVAVKNGGPHSISNTRPSCNRCNSRLHDHRETKEQ